MKNVLNIASIAALIFATAPAYSQNAWQTSATCVAQAPSAEGETILTIIVSKSNDREGKTSREIRIGVRTVEEILAEGTKFEDASIKFENGREFSGLPGVAGKGNLIAVILPDAGFLDAVSKGASVTVYIPTQNGTSDHTFLLSGSRKAVDRLKSCI